MPDATAIHQDVPPLDIDQLRHHVAGLITEARELLAAGTPQAALLDLVECLAGGHPNNPPLVAATALIMLAEGPHPSADARQDLAALFGYELGRSDERAELERAGRLLPADAQPEFGWDCGRAGEQCVHHILDEAGARRMAQRRGGVAVSRVPGQWRPVSSEDTGEATDAHQP